MNGASLQGMIACGVLVMVRLSSLLVFAPVFSSSAIAPRIKAGFVVTMTLLLAPLVAHTPGAVRELSVASVLSELAVGLVFGLSLMMLNEMVVFGAALLSMNFSFTLANLMDPIYHEETAVLGQLMGWVTTLLLLGAGLHRTLLTAVLRSFAVVPVGTFVMHAKLGATIAHMGGGVFLAGVQLASPVMAAALTVEITMALVGRLAPQLSSTVLNVPIKTLASYVVLIGSLSVWPGFVERHFNSLLDAAERMLIA